MSRTTMTAEDKLRLSGELSRAESPGLPTVEKSFQQAPRPEIHPAVYVTFWITLSSGVILFNKWLIDKRKFGIEYPIILTTWHLIFATIMTQTLARTTTLLDGRKTVKMTGRVCVRAILPIGFLFSMSLIFGNLTYLYLSVAFIQMLKATTPVAVLLVGWVMGITKPNMGVLFNVSFIVLGIVIATFGEITFIMAGFLFQCAGIAFEAVRLVLVQKLLKGEEYKMDPLVSLYYFAPICALMNGVIALVVEIPHISMQEVYSIGAPILIANALVAFLLNVSAVFLIGRTSSLVLTLCGVLKDVLLVAVSMTLWETPVSNLQFFGYAVSLAGLVYYKLGPEPIKAAADRCLIFTTTAAAAASSTKRPILKTVFIVLVLVVSGFVVLDLVLPSFVPNYDPKGFLLSGAASVGLAT